MTIEPDPMTAERLDKYVGRLPTGIRERIRVIVRAVSDTAGRLAFQSTGTVSASVSSDGTEKFWRKLWTRYFPAPARRSSRWIWKPASLAPWPGLEG